MWKLISHLWRRRTTAEAALRESRKLFHTLVETAPALIFATDRTGRNSFVNERYQTYTGLSFADLCGEGWISVIHPEDRPAAVAESQEAQVSPRSLERRLRIRRHDGQWRWFLSRTEPVEGASDLSEFAWLGISIDIDDQVHAEERERLLAQEVDHRAKNLLTVVQSVVQLTRGDDPRALKEAISGRVQALARSHGLLAASRWEGVELAALLQEELAPFPERVEMHGSAARLKPAAAQSMGLVLHELATNAAKYGSLSVTGGRVEVRWSCNESTLELSWLERAGPEVVQPAARGFGSVLIKASVERQLKGNLAIDWGVEGLSCTFSLPLSLTIATEKERLKKGAEPQPQTVASWSGSSILIVEDEALIGLQMENLLSALGWDVVGCAPSVADAVDSIVSAKPDAALLDVNLGGERSYPVADVLRAKGIPFAFVTGYASLDDLPARFEGAKLLSKPVQEADLVRTLRDILPSA